MLFKDQQKTKYLSSKDIKEQWFVIDCRDKVFGKVTNIAANILMGKNNFEYTPHAPNKNNVILINAKNIAMTGNKLSNNPRKQKIEIHHTGYIGALKKTPVTDIFNHPNDTKIINFFNKKVKNNLSDNKSTNAKLKRLHVYSDEKHKHTNHKLIPVNI